MIPITEKHLWEACRLAMEQDIAELEAQPCSYCFSEDFRKSMQQMQDKTDKMHGGKFSVQRPLRRFLPAAAVIALACLAGYRLLELAPFRMGSSGPGYSQNPEAAGTGADDAGEYTTETETAEEAGSLDETAGQAAAESDGAAVEYADILSDETAAADGNAEDEAVPESAEGRERASAGSPNAKTSKEKTDAKDEDRAGLQLLSVAYDASNRILELELRNNSARTIILENSWILFDANGETVNIEAIDPEPSRPSRLTPDKTTAIRCTLSDGELPEGEYTLDLHDGENTLTFSIP